jgi:hypothetical protein
MISWTVSQHRDEIGPADIVFLWVTGRNRGIRAVMRVDQAPREMAELESEQPYWAERDTEEKWRVIGTLTHRNVHLPHTQLREIKGLEELSVFHGFTKMTNYSVTPAQGGILLRLVGLGDAGQNSADDRASD